MDQYGKPILRTRSKILVSGYSNAGASLIKPVFKGWNWEGGAPDDDIITNLPIIRQRSRQLSMEAPVIAGLYRTLKNNAVGDGLKPEPTPDAEYLGMDQDDVKNWKKTVLRLWKTFAESPNCDAYRRDNFYEMTRLVCRAQAESGDCFVTMSRFERRNAPFALKIQITEADCVADPEGAERVEHEMLGNDIYGGVEISEWGHVVGYWFYTGHPLSIRKRHYYNYNFASKSKWIFIPAYGAETGLPNVLHLMESERPGQRRGIPLIAPVVELALTLDRYIKAEALAAQIQALFTVMIKSNNPEALIGEMDAMGGEEGKEATDGDEGLVSLGPGVVQYLREGEDATAFNPTRPTTAFEPFMNTLLQMIGPAVSMPYELLVQKFQASFSASQAAVNVAQKGFKVIQSGLVNDFCKPIYEAFLDEAVARGMLNAPGYFNNPIKRLAYSSAKWSGPGVIQIDLGKGGSNYEKLTSLGYATASEATSELTGGNYYENIAERGREIEAAKAAGLPVAAAEAMTQTAGAIRSAGLTQK